MRAYELILVTKSSLSEVLKKKLTQSIKSILGELKIVKENEVGLKSLAYKIKKETSGFYWDFFLEGENLPQDLDKRLLENENILRHLLIRNK